MKPLVSIIVATYNRHKTLKIVVQCLLDQRVRQDFAYEVLIVDNSLDGNARSLIEQLIPASQGKLFYYHEPAAGKCRALNTGIAKANGEILAFTDDDVIVGSDWLTNIAECFELEGCDGIGGRVLPIYPENTPAWVKENPHQLASVVVIFDQGEVSRFYGNSMERFIGANCAFKKSVFDDCGLFHVDIGPGTLIMGEDEEFFYRILSHKKNLYYCAQALIMHPVDLKRLNLALAAKWHVAVGRFEAKNEIKEGRKYYYCCGVPRYLLKGILVDLWHIIINCFNPIGLWNSWRSFFRKVGMIKEYRTGRQPIEKIKMNLPKVKVSVVIPTYNRAHFITRAIDCVLAQTYQDFEIIVVDDGSLDNTRDVLEAYKDKIKYFYQENRGISAARNRGIHEATGEYIAFLDSDDIWEPVKLAVQMSVIEKNSKIGIVHSKMLKIDENGNPCGFKPEKPTGKNFQELIEIGGDLPTSTVLARKECFAKVGVFDETLEMMEDFEMWLRISEYYEVYEIPGQILAKYSHHKNQITKNMTKVYESLIKLDRLILIKHPGAPRFIVRKRIAKNEYTLSRNYFKEERFREAFSLLISSFRDYPFVGLLFIDRTDSVTTKALKAVKPLGYLFVSIAAALKRSPKKSYNRIIKSSLSETRRVPSVSVVIPMFNRVRYLHRAVGSVLKQSYADYEIIIVDDGSTENVEEAIKKCVAMCPEKIFYVKQNNMGAGGARNTGIRMAKGKFLAFLDADDEWLDGFLLKTTEKLITEDCYWVDTMAYRVELDSSETVIDRRIIHDELLGQGPDLYKALLKGNIIGSSPKVVLKRECFERAGYFREDLRIGEDWELWLRIAKLQLKLDRVAEPLYEYKIRQNNTTKTQQAKAMECTYRILSDYSKDAFRVDSENRVLYAEELWNVARHLMRMPKKNYSLFLKCIIKSQWYAPSLKRVINSIKTTLKS